MGDINSTRLLKIIPLLKKAGKRSNFTVIHLISSLLNISVLWKTDKPIYLVPLKKKKNPPGITITHSYNSASEETEAIFSLLNANLMLRKVP